eukprot:TRINITY_DN8583_c0_g1_i1.p1 TRINITY_DN8583_c0_g1~~TRINITY_DN8583_c0_g1_i1.p1  ORF type:complete len:327 (+),score=78.14 TRINITY_DN8583_c0_g1_i1:287-1267(+)
MFSLVSYDADSDGDDEDEHSSSVDASSQPAAGSSPSKDGVVVLVPQTTGAHSTESSSSGTSVSTDGNGNGTAAASGDDTHSYQPGTDITNLILNGKVPTIVYDDGRGKEAEEPTSQQTKDDPMGQEDATIGPEAPPSNYPSPQDCYDPYGPTTLLAVPPKPEATPDPELVERIRKYHKLRRQGKTVNERLRVSKEFLNPSIEKKLIEVYEIDQTATNYPEHLFNPRAYDTSDYYDVIAEQQRVMLSQRESERKAAGRAPDFVSGGIIEPSRVGSGIQPPGGSEKKGAVISMIKGRKKGAVGAADVAATATGKKRKSKWDSSAPGKK